MINYVSTTSIISCYVINNKHHQARTREEVGRLHPGNQLASLGPGSQAYGTHAPRDSPSSHDSRPTTADNTTTRRRTIDATVSAKFLAEGGKGAHGRFPLMRHVVNDAPATTVSAAVTHDLVSAPCRCPFLDREAKSLCLCWHRAQGEVSSWSTSTFTLPKLLPPTARFIYIFTMGDCRGSNTGKQGSTSNVSKLEQTRFTVWGCKGLANL